MALKIEWTKVEVASARTSEDEANKVILKQSGKSVNRVNKIDIGANLVAQLGWKAGDRVTLYKGGTGLFKFSRETVGLHTLRSHASAKAGRPCRLFIVNVNLADVFNTPVNGTTFDAWVDDNDLIMRPGKQVR